MNKIVKVLGVALASLMIVVGWTGSAGAVDGRAAWSAVSVKHICETSGRQSALYRKLCMRTGTRADAARLWFSTPLGIKGRESVDDFDRRSLCKFAGQFGGIRPAVREAFFDVAYDSYLNHTAVLTWTGDVAAADCKSMGYRV